MLKSDKTKQKRANWNIKPVERGDQSFVSLEIRGSQITTCECVRVQILDLVEYGEVSTENL